MGCLAMQTFLVKNSTNPEISKISGLIFGAPFFGSHSSIGMNWSKLFALKLLS
jgi:hypothetical protein